MPAPRRSARLPTIAWLFATLPALVAAASPVSAAPALPAVGFKDQLSAPGLMQLDDTVMLFPGAAWYPGAEAATGAQGTAAVVMDLAPDGHVASAKIVVSTHAPALDEQALRLASALHWMGARKVPPQASLQVLFARDNADSVQKKTCAELNVDLAWMKTHDPAQPPEAVGALRTARGLVSLNTTWMPDRSDREALRPVREALFVASRRAIAECAAHPDERMKDVFNHLLHEAALAHEKAPAMPVPAASVGPLPRSILHTRRDDPFDAGSIWVLGGDPAYPVALLAAGVQGEVEVRVELGDAGAIDRVVVQRDDSGYPALADAAQDIARHRLAEMHLDKVDPAKLPAVVTLSVNFQRNDPRSVAALDCATYRVDAAAWRGDRPRLPDFQSLIDLLGSRAFGAMGADARLPRRSAMMFGAQDSVAEMKALDAACDAAPRKLAIDAIIDAIDAMPESR